MVVFANNLYGTMCRCARSCKKHIDKPVYIDNDANVAGLAEYKAGVSQGAANSIFLTLGTGVGAAVSSSAGASMWAATMSAPRAGSHDRQRQRSECTATRAAGRPTCHRADPSDGVAAAKAHPDSLIATSVGGDLSQITAQDRARRGQGRGPCGAGGVRQLPGVWPWGSSASSTASDLRLSPSAAASARPVSAAD